MLVPDWTLIVNVADAVPVHTLELEAVTILQELRAQLAVSEMLMKFPVVAEMVYVPEKDESHCSLEMAV